MNKTFTEAYFKMFSKNIILEDKASSSFSKEYIKHLFGKWLALKDGEKNYHVLNYAWPSYRVLEKMDPEAFEKEVLNFAINICHLKANKNGNFIKHFTEYDENDIDIIVTKVYKWESDFKFGDFGEPEFVGKVYDEDWKYIGKTKIHSSKSEVLDEAYNDIGKIYG